MRKLFLVITFVITASIVGALIHAPYLTNLLLEGYPGLVFSGRGEYSRIEGGKDTRQLWNGDIVAEKQLGHDLNQLFRGSDGAALLVARDGRLELEHYRPGIRANTKLNSYSMAKSLVGALIFKAIAEGRIGTLNARLSDFLPRYHRFGGVSLRALITMRAGLKFDNGGSNFGSDATGKDIDKSVNPFGPLARLHFRGIEAVEGELSIREQTSGAFSYQNVNTALLGEVLEEVYGQPLEVLLSEKIWQPAGASEALWRRPHRESSVSAYCCIFATARDWIRIGVFLSENGTASTPFLPEPLWREFMGLDIPVSELRKDHYGHHIRQNVLDRPGQALQGSFTYLMGQNGQVLYLMPQYRLVVYRAGEGLQLLHSTLYAAWETLGPQKPKPSLRNESRAFH